MNKTTKTSKTPKHLPTGIKDKCVPVYSVFDQLVHLRHERKNVRLRVKVSRRHADALERNFQRV